MAELNLDISQELNITARRGDSISFTLQFKDSSGDALDLSSDADDNDDSTDETTYKFNMEVRTAADDDSDTPVLMNKINEISTLPQSGADTFLELQVRLLLVWAQHLVVKYLSAWGLTL